MGVTSCIIKAKDKWLKNNGVTKIQQKNYAQLLWIRQIQLDSFNKDIAALENNKSLPRESRLLKLSPFLDKGGLLRVKGRVEYSPETHYKYQPLILDSKHPVTQLLLRHFHEKYFHRSNETVINELQQVYWIMGLRKTLRRIIGKCIICKITRGLPPNPKMAKLLEARLGYLFHPLLTVVLTISVL